MQLQMASILPVYFSLGLASKFGKELANHKTSLTFYVKKKHPGTFQVKYPQLM